MEYASQWAVPGGAGYGVPILRPLEVRGRARAAGIVVRAGVRIEDMTEGERPAGKHKLETGPRGPVTRCADTLSLQLGMYYVMYPVPLHGGGTAAGSWPPEWKAQMIPGAS